jgi:membrane fusion protein (multidrug efflux system)
MERDPHDDAGWRAGVQEAPRPSPRPLADVSWREPEGELDVRERDAPRIETETGPRVSSEKPRARFRRAGLIATGVVLAALLIAGGITWWLNVRNYASTTDAEIDGNVTQMASQVAGRVIAIRFADNQHVNAGQVLIEIDPRDYQVRLDDALAQQQSANAQVQQARAQVDVQQANLDQAQANVLVVQADLTQAQQDYNRYHRINPAAITKQQLDQADATFHAQTAKLAAAKQAVEGARAQIAAAKGQLAAAEASLHQAQANVETARLQLSYTTIAAPVAGRVTHRTVNVGDYVQPGQPLFALVQDDLWVTANFKETELADMKPGDPVTITVDAVPGVTLHGRVDSFMSGTGSVFSALPAENATGNWVKVVQRLPVKITFDGDTYKKYFLAPGMSVEPSVKVR